MLKGRRLFYYYITVFEFFYVMYALANLSIVWTYYYISLFEN